MKVLQINSVCGYGSTGRIAVDLYHMLEEQGHDCCIAYGRGTAPDDIQTIKIGNKVDFYFHALITRIFDEHGFASKRATRKFIQQAKEYNPDIIHLHNIHGYYINIEVLFQYLKEANRPVIWTLHDCWSFTGHCAHFAPTDCYKWKEQCEECELKGEYPQSCFLDHSKKNYFRKKRAFLGVENLLFITPSKWLSNMLKQSFLKDYNVTTIPNGIDNQVFYPIDVSQITQKKEQLTKKYGIDFSKKIFLGVASVWTKDKGFTDFIKISEIVPEEVQIVLVGVSKKQKKMLSSNIIGIERTENQKELASLYACADVFLNPTYADTFPTVNMEAITCGTPVVTYMTCGSPESILEGCGHVVAKGQYKELALRAKDLADSNRKIAVSNKFDKKDSCSKYYDIYMKSFESI